MLENGILDAALVLSQNNPDVMVLARVMLLSRHIVLTRVWWSQACPKDHELEVGPLDF